MGSPLRPLLQLGSFVVLAVAACGSTTTDDAASGASNITAGCPEGSIAAANGCTSFLSLSCALPAVPAGDAVNLTTDRVFTTPFRGQSYAAPQALDVAWPKAAATTTTAAPIALLVHGGGWSGGDKNDHREDILRLAGQGWVAASVNYRRVFDHWQNRFPAAISDVRCAVRWLRTHATELGADPRRIVALGDSAGGELVELLGTSPDAMALDDGQCELEGSVAVGGVVSYYGRANLSVAPIPDYLVDYIGRDGDWPSREALGSPLRHVDAHTAPTLLIHGQDDGTVPIAQSRAMRDALRNAGVTVGLMELPGQGHGFPFFGTSGTQPYGACSTLSFLAHF